MSRFAATLLCWALLAASAALGAESPGKAEVASKPEIVVKQIDAAEKISIGKGIRIRVTVKNGGETIQLTHVSVSPAQALRLSFQEHHASPFSLKLPDGKTQLNPNEVLEFGEVDLEKPSLMKLGNWDMLTYRPKKEAIMVELSYVSLADNVPGRVVQALDVDVTAHPLGLFAGAVVGTLLGAIFVTLFRAQKAVESLPSPKAADVAVIIGKETGRAAFIFLKATVAAGIVILVLQSTSGVKFPIEVSVNDFFGGLVMGLIGERVASGVYEWIVKP